MDIKKILLETYSSISSRQKGRSIRKYMSQKVRIEGKDIMPLKDDEIREIQKHWNAYGIKPHIDSFNWFYHVSGYRDWRFITEDVYAERIIPYLYDGRKAIAIDDKICMIFIFLM